MEINFSDYLSEDEKKQIVADVFRAQCEADFKKDAERIFSNAAYNTVYKIVDDMHDGKVDEIVAQKAVDVIAKLSEYSVFRAQSYWNDQSKAHNAMNDAIVANKQRLIDRIAAIIDEMEKEALSESLKDFAMDLLDEKLFGAKE